MIRVLVVDDSEICSELLATFENVSITLPGRSPHRLLLAIAFHQPRGPQQIPFTHDESPAARQESEDSSSGWITIEAAPSTLARSPARSNSIESPRTMSHPWTSSA